jgi:predicted phosphodiesterase
MKNLQHLDGTVLVFGGPYGNIQATQAMRSAANQLAIPAGNIICNGDLVAYCANPEETVDLIRDWGINVVQGNCEESIGALSDDCGCGFENGSLCSALSAEWYSYSKAKVSISNQQWMAQLPRVIKFQFGELRFAVIHGGVDDISEFLFASSPTENKRNAINHLSVDCVIGGHCGVPFGQQVDTGYWLNTGVIGMPANDGTQDGWYLLLEPSGDIIYATWHRLPFDTCNAEKAMRQAGLGQAYRKALVSGLWPSLDILPKQEQESRGVPITPEPLLIA